MKAPTFANGGSILEIPGTAARWGSKSNNYMIIEFSNMPVREPRLADEVIGGTNDATSGRLVYQPSDTVCLPDRLDSPAPPLNPVGAATVVNICYVANQIE